MVKVCAFLEKRDERDERDERDDSEVGYHRNLSVVPAVSILPAVSTNY